MQHLDLIFGALGDGTRRAIVARLVALAHRCERGPAVASRRVAASAKRARAGNSVISHATPRALQSVVLGTLWVRRRHFWWGASPQRSNFSNPPYYYFFPVPAS